MDEWFGINTSSTYEEFLARNKEVKKLSYEIDSMGRHGRIWVEDIFGNIILLLTNISNGLILEVRCYAPYDPSLILYLLIKREGSQVIPKNNHLFLPYNYKEYKIATLKIL